MQRSLLFVKLKNTDFRKNKTSLAIIKRYRNFSRRLGLLFFYRLKCEKTRTRLVTLTNKETVKGGHFTKHYGTSPSITDCVSLSKTLPVKHGSWQASWQFEFIVVRKSKMATVFFAQEIFWLFLSRKIWVFFYLFVKVMEQLKGRQVLLCFLNNNLQEYWIMLSSNCTSSSFTVQYCLLLLE